jgi:tetratricopeptide (TPR) repeat protein
MKYNITPVIAVSLILLFTAAAGAQGEYDEVEALISDGKLDEAQLMLRRAVSYDNKDVIAAAMLGYVYLRKGERTAAMKYLKMAESIDPQFPVTYLYLGDLYYSMQRFDEAAAAFNRYMQCMEPLVAGNEANIDAYVGDLHHISQIYFGFKRYDDAAKVLDEIIRYSSHDQSALYNYGVYYYIYKRNRSKAYASFSKAIDADPSSSIAAKARYAIEFIRANPDPRMQPDFSFLDREYRD